MDIGSRNGKRFPMAEESITRGHGVMQGEISFEDVMQSEEC